MKKTAIFILIATLTIFFCLGLTSCAAGENYDGFTVVPNEDGTYTLIGYTGEATAVTVPADFGGKAVSAIGTGAFKNNVKIEKITLPESVKVIGASAFSGCTALSVLEGGSYSEIPSSAFSGCTALASIALPSELENIGYRAFSGCTSLAKIDLPESVKTVYHYAFADCTALSVFDIKGDGLSVYANAFAGCTALKSISTPANGAPDAVYKFSDGVMFSEDGKTLVSFIRADREYTIPASVTEIAPGAFFEKYTLEKIFVAEGNPALVSLGGVVYSKDESVLVVRPAGAPDTSVHVREGVLEIADCAFSGNPLVKVITLPLDTKKIGKSAFENCTAVEEFHFSGVNATVGAHAFDGCISQTTYVIPDHTVDYKLIDGVVLSADGETLVSYPSVMRYSVFEIPATVKKVLPGAFKNAYNTFSQINVAEGNNYLYSNVNALYTADRSTLIAVVPSTKGEFVIDPATTEIYEGAFSGCANITKITVPEGVTEIPADAFSGCASLAEITMKGTVTKIANGAFSGCDALKNVNYKGTQAQWASAKAGTTGNDVLNNAEVKFN